MTKTQRVAVWLTVNPVCLHLSARWMPLRRASLYQRSGVWSNAARADPAIWNGQGELAAHKAANVSGMVSASSSSRSTWLNRSLAFDWRSVWGEGTALEKPSMQSDKSHQKDFLQCNSGPSRMGHAGLRLPEKARQTVQQPLLRSVQIARPDSGCLAKQ